MAQYENFYPDMAAVDHYEATRYASRDQRWLSREELELVAQAVAALPAPRKRVLDAPSGYGRFSPYLAQLGLRPTNVDISTPMVARTVSRLAQQAVATTGVTGDLIGGLPFAPDAFDGAVSIRMLHNWPDPAHRQAILRSFAAVVRDWLVITFYDAPPVHRLQFGLRRRFKPSARQSMAMVPRERFVAEAAAAGFRVESMRAVLPVLHAQTVAVLRRA